MSRFQVAPSKDDTFSREHLELIVSQYPTVRIRKSPSTHKDCLWVDEDYVAPTTITAALRSLGYTGARILAEPRAWASFEWEHEIKRIRTLRRSFWELRTSIKILRLRTHMEAMAEAMIALAKEMDPSRRPDLVRRMPVSVVQSLTRKATRYLTLAEAQLRAIKKSR